MTKRKLKKAILAETLKLFREHPLPSRTFTIDLTTGNLVHIEAAAPYEFLTDLLNLCAQYDGRVKA